MGCPICKEKVKNLFLHFKRKLNCGAQIDLEDFELAYQQFKKEKTTQQNRIRKEQERKRTLSTFYYVRFPTDGFLLFSLQ